MESPLGRLKTLFYQADNCISGLFYAHLKLFLLCTTGLLQHPILNWNRTDGPRPWTSDSQSHPKKSRSPEVLGQIFDPSMSRA
jgi:hypothetical protein